MGCWHVFLDYCEWRWLLTLVFGFSWMLIIWLIQEESDSPKAPTLSPWEYQNVSASGRLKGVEWRLVKWGTKLLVTVQVYTFVSPCVDTRERGCQQERNTRQPTAHPEARKKSGHLEVGCCLWKSLTIFFSFKRIILQSTTFLMLFADTVLIDRSPWPPPPPFHGLISNPHSTLLPSKVSRPLLYPLCPSTCPPHMPPLALLVCLTDPSHTYHHVTIHI